VAKQSCDNVYAVYGCGVVAERMTHKQKCFLLLTKNECVGLSHRLHS